MPLKVANQLLLDEASSRGWETSILDEDSQIIVVTPPNEEPILLRYTVTELSSAIGVRVANSKAASSLYLSSKGYPFPATEIYTDAESALNFLLHNKKIIVKPSSMSQGIGITTGIEDEQALSEAISTALKEDSTILLQQHIEGDEHRFLIIGGECVAVLRREPASVMGDGINTIEQLIIKENLNPERDTTGMTAKKTIDLEGAKRYLKEKASTVPLLGEKVFVIDTSNISRGGTSIDMTDKVHDSQKAMAVEAAKELGLGVAGVDIMSRDITADISTSESYILEIEENPGLRIHHFPGSGQPQNVAGKLLDAILKSRHH